MGKVIQMTKLCSVSGCGKPSTARGLCPMHYARMKNHGSLDDPRQDLKDLGPKDTHPLWVRWLQLRRRAVLCDVWMDFRTFAADVGDPGNSNKLARLRAQEPYGPDNFFWTEPMEGERKVAYHRAYNEEFKDTARDQRFRRAYGISLSEYETLSAAQGHCCAICSRPERVKSAQLDGIKRLAIDHDHGTGAVRGLLCHDCNTGLGSFQDREDIVLRAVAYLQAHKVQPREATG